MCVLHTQCTECTVIRSEWSSQAAGFLCCFDFLPYLFNICCSFQIFLKTSMIQSHSADDSLIVWTLQHSSTQGARFLQSQFCQVAFRIDICPADPAAKELIVFNHVLASDFRWLVFILRVSHYPYLLTSEVYLASKTVLL